MLFSQLRLAQLFIELFNVVLVVQHEHKYDQWLCFVHKHVDTLHI